MYWWGGIPYYYYDSAYYTYDNEDAGYVLADPPPVADPYGSAEGQPDDQLLENLGNPPPDSLYIYPRNGQSEEQTATDRYECHNVAVEQSGFDPTTSGTTGSPADYRRAMIACLDQRGYSAN